MIPSHRRPLRPPESRTPWIKRPNIGPASEPRVMNAVAQRGDDRHRRLQNETKGHRAAGPIKNVGPKTAETFGGDPVPGHPESEEADQEQDCDPRLQELRFSTARQSKPEHSAYDSIRLRRKLQHLCGRDRADVNGDRLGRFRIVAVRSPVKAAALRGGSLRRSPASLRSVADVDDAMRRRGNARRIAPRRFAPSTSRIPIRRRSTASSGVSIAIAIRSGAERKICCCGLWRSRAQIEQSLSLGAERRRPRVTRSWSPTRA